MPGVSTFTIPNPGGRGELTICVYHPLGADLNVGIETVHRAGVEAVGLDQVRQVDLAHISVQLSYKEPGDINSPPGSRHTPRTRDPANHVTNGHPGSTRLSDVDDEKEGKG